MRLQLQEKHSDASPPASLFNGLARKMIIWGRGGQFVSCEQNVTWMMCLFSRVTLKSVLSFLLVKGTRDICDLLVVIIIHQGLQLDPDLG